jgi:5-methylcytosine-specific restriction enzyme A
MPIRLCSEPRCGNEVRDAGSKGRCDFHYRQMERQRSRSRREDARARNVMYASKRWWALRRDKLLQNPGCELQHPGCLGLASEVHHKVAMEQGGAAWELSNLVSCCKRCHSKETRREQLGRVGDDSPSAA